MRLADLVAEPDVLVDHRTSSKKRLLAEFAAHAAHRVGVAPDVILDALIRREELGSTGTGDGIALPHARLAEVAEPFGVFARLRTPIDFDAVDGQAVDLVFLLLLPSAHGGRQLNALACVSRKLRDPATARTLRGARTAGELHERLVAEETRPLTGERGL